MISAEGRLTKINIEYFQYFDKIIDIPSSIMASLLCCSRSSTDTVGRGSRLQARGAALRLAHYCRYLVARFGARPAIYLPCGDGSGIEPQVAAGGPRDPRLGRVWLNRPESTTGRITAMTSTRSGLAGLPVLSDRARRRPCPRSGRDHVGLPAGEGDHERRTRYEHRSSGVAEGWWQGNEAWINLCAGGRSASHTERGASGNGGWARTSPVTPRTTWTRAWLEGSA